MSSADTEYDTFERLVNIETEGTSFAVPANNILLSCVQFILDAGMVLGRFCWSNECGNCELTCHTPNQPEAQRARGCQTIVQAGMVLSELTPDLRYWLREKLK